MRRARRTADAAAALPPDEGLFRVLRDDGTADPAHDPDLDAAAVRAIYRSMLLVRLLDARMMNLQRQGRIGFYGTATGQEAATVASAFALGPHDWIFPALREGGAALARGLPLEAYVAQCVGNSADASLGRQMPCHFTMREPPYVAMSSCIATQVSHAVGAAMAAKVRGDPVVVLGYLGDGATSENDFHAAMTFAGVFRPPVVLVCQNNAWAISVPSSRQTASKTFAIKARAYGVPGVRVDGNDALAVYRVVREAVDRARGGGGPTFVEAVTYRRGGHSSSDDPTRYRDPGEVEAWERRDPLARLRRHLERRGAWSDADEERATAEIQDAVSAAIAAVEAAPPLPVESLVRDVYAGVPPHLRAQIDDLRRAGGAGAEGPEGEFPL